MHPFYLTTLPRFILSSCHLSFCFTPRAAVQHSSCSKVFFSEESREAIGAFFRVIADRVALQTERSEPLQGLVAFVLVVAAKARVLPHAAAVDGNVVVRAVRAARAEALRPVLSEVRLLRLRESRALLNCLQDDRRIPDRVEGSPRLQRVSEFVSRDVLLAGVRDRLAETLVRRRLAEPLLRLAVDIVECCLELRAHLGEVRFGLRRYQLLDVSQLLLRSLLLLQHGLNIFQLSLLFAKRPVDEGVEPRIKVLRNEVLRADALLSAGRLLVENQVDERLPAALNE